MPKKRKCRQCISGYVPNTTATFDPNCSGCLEKKATGKRTGLEPLPSKYGGFRKQIDGERLNAVRVKYGKAAAIKRSLQTPEHKK